MERAGGARTYRPRVRARTALEGTILKPGAKPGATRTSVDALGADEHGVAEQQLLRLLGRNNALRGGGRHGHLRGRGLGVGLVLRGRDGRVSVGRGHGGGRYGCLTLGARLTVEIWRLHPPHVLFFFR